MIMYKTLGISDEVVKLVEEAEKDCREEFLKIDNNSYINSLKVLSSFHKNEITESHFNSTTGYGYNDLGRDGIEKVFRKCSSSKSVYFRITCIKCLLFCFTSSW